MRLALAATIGLAAAALILAAVLVTEAPLPPDEPGVAVTSTPRPAPTAATAVASAPSTATAAPVASPSAVPTPTRAASLGAPLLAYEPGVRSGRLDANGWPRGAVGPLVVYRREVEEELPRDTSNRLVRGVDERSEIVTFDLGRGVEVAVVELDVAGLPLFRLVGSTLFVRTEHGLWTYRLDGSEGRQLLALTPSRYLERFEPNEDGSLVAVNFFWRTTLDDNHLQVIDVESGDVILDLPQERADEAGFRGTVGPDEWSSDGSTIALVGYTYSESPGGYGTVSLDGSLEVLGRGTPGRIESPFDDRPIVAVPDDGFRCAHAGYAGATRLALLDPATDAVINVATADDPVLHVAGWSPNADEYAFTVHDLPSDVANSVVSAYAQGRCPNDTLAGLAGRAPRTWWVLPTDGAPAQEIGTLEDLHRRWYGDRAITFTCGGEIRVGLGDRGRSGPPFDDPLCNGPVVHGLLIGGTPAGEGIYIEVLGIVDPP